MYIIDTSAWIEIFLETEMGKKVAQVLQQQSSLFTANISIAEISKWCYLNNIKVQEVLVRVENSTSILYSTRFSEQRAGQIWVEANKKNPKNTKQIGLIDCLIAAIAEENDLTVLTKDKHFLAFEKIKKEII